MSYKNFLNVSKGLEDNRRYSTGDKAAGFGFRRVSVLSQDAEMTLTGLRDMDDDVMFIMDWRSLKFCGTEFFNRKRHQNNEEFFLTRDTGGYTYIVDMRFFGDLVVYAPSYNGVVHTISY